MMVSSPCGARSGGPRRSVAFDEARSSLCRLGLPEILPKLHGAGVSISRTVLGGSHSVAVYPPIDSLTPCDPRAIVESIACGGQASLYVHIAFCETRCTFCHYVVDHYTDEGAGSQVGSGKVARYLDAVKRELRFWAAKLAASGTALSSIYIGGGTPLVLRTVALDDILRTIRDHYTIRAEAEVCVEGSPLTISAPDGEDKLRFLQEHGVTRLSFGVQSFDDTVLKYAARGYRRDVAIRAAVIADEIFDNWNLDLIQGLYQGSPSEAWNNLEVLGDLRPAHLTWYHGRFADRPQGAWYRTAARQASFEDESATLLGRMLIWQGMAALGYQQIDGNRFVRECRYTDPFKAVRTSVSSTLLGAGAASYSHFDTGSPNGESLGYVFRNQSQIPAYIDSVLSGGIPIATGRVIDEQEVLASSYATGLRGGRFEDDHLRSIRERHNDLSTHYEALATQLIDLGVLEPYRDGGEPGLRMTELGRLFEDEVLALFFSPGVKKALAMNASA